jgi:hypothetical protein
MNDEYFLNDILESEKNMVVNMSIALNEASSNHIYETYYKMFEKLSKETKTLFNIAYNLNYYTLEEAENNKICEEINKLSKKLGDNS